MYDSILFVSYFRSSTAVKTVSKISKIGAYPQRLFVRRGSEEMTLSLMGKMTDLTVHQISEWDGGPEWRTYGRGKDIIESGSCSYFFLSFHITLNASPEEV